MENQGRDLRCGDDGTLEQHFYLLFALLVKQEGDLSCFVALPMTKKVGKRCVHFCGEPPTNGSKKIEQSGDS